MSAADLPRLLIGGFFLVLAVAGVIYFFSFTDTRTATTTGTVVRIVTHTGGNYSRSECAVFAFEVNGQAFEEESNDCDRDTPYAMGEQVAVRFDPAAPHDVVPDTDTDPLFPLLFGVPFSLAVSAFFLWPKRR